jgi:hypothetical protein
MKDEFPLAPGVPMHLLTERGLNEAFLDVVERHRREGLGVVVRRNDQLTRLPVEELSPEIRAARQRIAELDAQIAQFRRPFSLNEAPPSAI